MQQLSEVGMQMDSRKVVAKPKRAINAAEAVSISGLYSRVWPRQGGDIDEERVQYLHACREAGADQKIVLIPGSPVALAVAAVGTRVVKTTAGELLIMTLGGVCSHPDHRGVGLGKAVVVVALDLLSEMGCSLCLFQCSDLNRQWYEGLGARTIDNSVVNSCADDPQASAFWDPNAMVYPSDAHLPEGPIDICGPAW